MNKEEIIQILKDNPIKIIKCGDIEIPVEYLKQTTVNVNGDNYIRLQQENKQLKERIAYLERSNNRREDTILEQRQKISDLEDNWNKLKEWLEKELGDRINPNKDKWLTGVYDAYKETIDKMQELEQGSDSNEY